MEELFERGKNARSFGPSLNPYMSVSRLADARSIVSVVDHHSAGERDDKIQEAIGRHHVYDVWVQLTVWGKRSNRI